MRSTRIRLIASLSLAVALLAFVPGVASAFPTSISSEQLGASASPPIIEWPYLVWSPAGRGTVLRDLRDGHEMQIPSGDDVFLSEDMVGCRDGAVVVARFHASGETTELPSFVVDNVLRASGTKLLLRGLHPRVYDCATGSMEETLAGAGLSRSAIEDDRLVWPYTGAAEYSVKMWDIDKDTVSVVATSPASVMAVGIEGDRVVYASNKDGLGSALYLVDLATGTETMLVRAWPTPAKIVFDGDYIYFDGNAIVRLFNLRTRTLSFTAAFSFAQWDASGPYIAGNFDGVLHFGTADATPPVTEAPAQESYFASARIPFTVTDNLNAAAECRTFWRMDGGEAVESSVAVTAVEGAHTVEFWSVDQMGNEELPHRTVSFVVERGYAVEATAGPNGSISPAGSTLYHEGAECTYTITPAAGYHIADVLVDGISVGPVSSYRFAGMSTDHTVSAVFAVTLPTASVQTPVAPSTMYRNRSATIWGYVAPKHSSGTYLVTLRFYKKNSAGDYVYHHSVKAKRYYYSSSKTKYKATTSLPHSGKWRVRAVHECAAHAVSYSGYDYITVR